jgi:hypothetical protein
MQVVLVMVAGPLTSPIFRSWSYELFLCSHQGIAIGIAYALWGHGASQSSPRLYMIMSASVFLTLFALHLTFLYRNVSMHRGFPRALIAWQHSATRMTIFVPTL